MTVSWTHTFVTGEIVTAAEMNGMVPNVTQNDVTASRAINGTVYQNTSGGMMAVSVSVDLIVAATSGTDLTGSNYTVAYCASGNPPTTVINQTINDVTLPGITTPAIIIIKGHHYFLVKPNYYYRVTSGYSGDGQAPTLDEWIEWTMI